MIPVLIAQFLSALADNMLLYVMIELIKQDGATAYELAGLQQTFLISYIALAPFVGAVADGYPKNKVMFFANSVKFIGVCLLLFGGNPYLSYGLVGVGAAIYSPAKYGILKEIKGKEFLVKANALMEGLTIPAILVGTVLGGLLAKYATDNNDFSLVISLITAIYLVASISNLFIPKLQAERKGKIRPTTLLSQFFKDFKVMWGDFSSRVTLMGTSLFFGVGSTLRIWLVTWIPLALNKTGADAPAMFSAIIAVGIIIGSGLASCIPIAQAHRVVSAGVGMGGATAMLSMTSYAPFAYVCLLMIGVFGGLFLVPLNALLQKQGHELVGGGQAIAIQNVCENGVMLLMLFAYQLLVSVGLSAIHIGFAFGGLVTALMLALRLYARGRPL